MSERFNHVMLHIGTWGVNSINAEQRETEVYKAVSDGLVTSAKHVFPTGSPLSDRDLWWYVYTKEGLEWLWQNFSYYDRKPLIEYLIGMCKLQPNMREHYENILAYRVMSDGALSDEASVFYRGRKPI